MFSRFYEPSFEGKENDERLDDCAEDVYGAMTGPDKRRFQLGSKQKTTGRVPHRKLRVGRGYSSRLC